MLSNLPFRNYKEAWKSFRSITNETSATAKHLVNNTSILKHRSIIDLGSGDGSLLRNLIMNKNCPISNALLVDMEAGLIANAKANLQNSPLIGSADFINRDLTTLDFTQVFTYNAILASHVFYLIDEIFLSKLLYNLPHQTTMYVVLDEPYSVFDSFWVHTAAFYHKHLGKIHEILSNLPVENFRVIKTVIKSKMTSPLLLPDDKKIDVLSLLCYSDAKILFDADPDFFSLTFKKFQTGNFLYYNSYCYEISKSINSF